MIAGAVVAVAILAMAIFNLVGCSDEGEKTILTPTRCINGLTYQRGYQQGLSEVTYFWFVKDKGDGSGPIHCKEN